MASKKENTALAAQNPTGFAVLANTDFTAMVSDELDGLDLTFERVKIPAGGSTAFELPTETEDTETVKEFSAVILHHHPLNAYYETKYTGGSNPPDCGSFDGKVGNSGRSCAACPHNQFGTGENGAKACKNKRRVYILREGERFPLLLTLPTGSLKAFTKYLKTQLSKGRTSKPVEDVGFAKDVHIVSENNYGFAGAAFMRAICAQLRENPDYLKKLFNQTFSNEFKQRGLKNIHADYVAAVAMGDYLAETLIFGTDAETTLREAIACGEEIYALNEQQMSSDAVERAWDFIVGWLVSNESRFSFDASPFYGIKNKSPGGQRDEFFVIPQYLDEALEKEGFNVKKTFQGLRERGLVETHTDKGTGKVRTKIQKRIDGKLVACYAFRLTSDEIAPLGGKGRNSHAD